MRRYRALLVLVAVLVAAAVPTMAAAYVGDANSTWLLSKDAKVGWLYVQNAGSATQAVLRLGINGADILTVSEPSLWDGKYLYVFLGDGLAVGENVDVTLTAGKAINLTSVTLGSFGATFVVSGTTASIVSVGGVGNAAIINLLPTAGVIPTLDIAASYVLKTDGTHVGLALTDTDARGYDYGTNLGGDLIRMWLPTTVGAGDSVVLAFDIAPRVFSVTLGNQGNR